MAKKIDFTRLKEPQKNYLAEQPKEVLVVDNLKKKKKIVEQSQEPKKMGRPIMGDAPLNKKISIALTEKEENAIFDKAGGVPVSAYLRGMLKKSGVI